MKDKLIMEHPDEQRLKKLFDELEFRTFSQRLSAFLSLQPDENAKIKDQKSNLKIKTKPGLRTNLTGMTFFPTHRIHLPLRY